MELLMIAGLIAAVVWLMRKTDLNASERVRGMDDADLADAAAYDMACDRDESPYYDELARRAALMARLAR